MSAELWDSFATTDPKYTKKFSRSGGFSGTAINATYVTRKLTEKFGPCGSGWTFVLDAEDYREGHTLKSGDRCVVHVIRGHIRYRGEDGNWTETAPQFGQTTFLGENKYGAFTDEEAPKKSITDCLTKCALYLGIGADIHLGLYDDNKYVNSLRESGNSKNAPTETVTVEPPKRESAMIGLTEQRHLHGLAKKLLGEVEIAGRKPKPSEIEKMFRGWLADQGYVDDDGNGTTKRIPLAAFAGLEADLREQAASMVKFVEDLKIGGAA